MNNVYLAVLAAAFMMFCQVSFAQSATDPDGTQRVKSSTENISAEQPAQSNPVAYDKNVPSAYQFLIEFCEKKEGHYYLPKKKYLELTIPQQDYIQHKQTLFIIEE
jgi:hypothetical protein